MNFKQLIYLYCFNDKSNRQIGKTTEQIKMARKLDAVFVAHSEMQKQRLQREHPDVDIRAPLEPSLVGLSKPVVFDHYLLNLILSESYDIKYKSELKELLSELKRIRQIADNSLNRYD